MSIAVLRTFLSKRKQEHEESILSVSKKHASKVVQEPDVDSEAVMESVTHTENSKGKCEVSQEISQDKFCSIFEDPAANQEGKGQGELKPPRVLEVIDKLTLFILLCFSSNRSYVIHVFMHQWLRQVLRVWVDRHYRLLD